MWDGNFTVPEDVESCRQRRQQNTFPVCGGKKISPEATEGFNFLITPMRDLLFTNASD
jgi:hypothetical protein